MLLAARGYKGEAILIEVHTSRPKLYLQDSFGTNVSTHLDPRSLGNPGSTSLRSPAQMLLLANHLSLGLGH